jgi:hypothetical protein
MATAAVQAEWIYPKIAGRMLGITGPTLLKHAAHSGIRVRTFGFPGGVRTKVNRADVERILAQMEAREKAALETPRAAPPSSFLGRPESLPKQRGRDGRHRKGRATRTSAR